MTAGELRKILETVPDDTVVKIDNRDIWPASELKDLMIRDELMPGYRVGKVLYMLTGKRLVRCEALRGEADYGRRAEGVAR